MPREQWDALVAGEGCKLCADIEADVLSNAFVHTVADLGVSRLWLGANQSIAGYSIVVCRRHVQDPHDLPDAERRTFFDDITRAARALERVFRPLKLNYHIMGNEQPHLHCHLIPRYYGDPAPHRPLFTTGDVRLSPEEYAERAAAIRAALSAVGTDASAAV
jgi:diadenosine tetraphosphate (Ap4A) HIT family hydrolase